MTVNEIKSLEWPLFTYWDQLLATDSYKEVKKHHMDMLLDLIISLCVDQLNCSKKEFEKIFKEKNIEFYSLKKKLYRKVYYLHYDRGPLLGLKLLLRVSVGINFLETS